MDKWTFKLLFVCLFSQNPKELRHGGYLQLIEQGVKERSVKEE